MVVLETEHYLMEVVGRQEQGFSLGRMVTYTLSNMPCGMPSLCRPYLPAQTMHESVYSSFFSLSVLYCP